jgi:hypothetical protein
VITDDPSLYHASTLQVILGVLIAMVTLFAALAGLIWRGFKAARTAITESITEEVAARFSQCVQREDLHDLCPSRDEFDRHVAFMESNARWQSEQLIGIAKAVGGRAP